MLAARAQCPAGPGDEKQGVGPLRAMWANALLRKAFPHCFAKRFRIASQSVSVQQPAEPGKVPVLALYVSFIVLTRPKRQLRPGEKSPTALRQQHKMRVLGTSKNLALAPCA